MVGVPSNNNEFMEDPRWVPLDIPRVSGVQTKQDGFSWNMLVKFPSWSSASPLLVFFYSPSLSLVYKRFLIKASRISIRFSTKS